MSGDYKLGELLYRATLDKNFIGTVERMRADYSIPNGGYATVDDAELNENMMVECYELQVEYGIPHTNPLAVYHYVLYGIEDWDSYESYTEPFYILENPKTLRHDIEDLYNKTKQPYVKLLIPSYASLSDVKEHLNKTWKDIQAELEKQSGDKIQRVRPTKNKNRDQLIRELNKKSKKELETEYSEESHKPKDIMIANILKDTYGYNATSDQIRSTPYKTRKK